MTSPHGATGRRVTDAELGTNKTRSTGAAHVRVPAEISGRGSRADVDWRLQLQRAKFGSMSLNIPDDEIKWAIGSLNRHSDGDLFPRPVEMDAVLGIEGIVVQRLSSLDLSTHSPAGARRFVVPKDDLSYRSATQLDIVDSILLTALIRQYGVAIEALRRPIAERSVFSYRFAGSVSGDLYSAGDPWNEYWSRAIELAGAHRYVLSLDIADFYNQIYHHTVENMLMEAGLPNQARKWILRLLESLTAKVSRGIPVGPHASHLIAEATMIPVDNSLAARGRPFCRYVDDIAIFVGSENDARAANLEAATILDRQQRLQLQRGKTRIRTSAEFINHATAMIADHPVNTDEAALIAIVKKYAGGDRYKTLSINELEPEDLYAFDQDVVEGILGEYLGVESVDFVRLRWFLRRLAQFGHPAAVQFCLDHFDRLTPALSEIAHYFIAVSEQGESVEWPRVGDRLLDALSHPIVAANEYAQLSILSLFGREPELNHLPQLISRYSTASPHIRREIVLAAVSADAIDWIRELKEEFRSMDPWTRRAMLVGVKEFPADERKFFLKFVEPETLSEEILVAWAGQSLPNT